MAKRNEALEKLNAMKAEIDKRYKESVQRYGGKVEPKPVCSLCGGYAHVAAAALCKAHAEELDGAMYCNYCLSNVTGYTVDELKEQYNALCQK